MTSDVVTPIVSTDLPTRRLMLAFERSGWLATVFGPRALFRSPDRAHSIVIRVGPEQPDRIIEVKRGPGDIPPGQPIPLEPIGIAEATEFVKAHTAACPHRWHDEAHHV